MYQGAIDNQTPDQKAKNYSFNEMVVSANPVLWEERDWKRYPIRMQDGSGSCVAQTIALMYSIIFKQRYNLWKDFSSSFPYRRRSDKTQSGMQSTDVLNIVPKIGNVFEDYLIGQNMSDSQIDSLTELSFLEDMAVLYKMNVITFPTLDFEEIASVTQTTGKGIMVWFKFAIADWTDIPFNSGQPIISGHSVTVVDAVLYKGKKYLVIQDSWGQSFGLNGFRLISEEYFKDRCFFACYFMSFKKLVEATDKPHFDGSIKSLQDILKYEGFFALNIDSTGIFGNITQAALISFQKKYNIVPSLGNFGPLTKAKLLELYP